MEQGVERIVDQVVNPKVASVFIPQVEELVYNYLGIPRRKSIANSETSNGKLHVDTTDLLPTDLEAVSPGSVKSHTDEKDVMDSSMTEIQEDIKMDVDDESKPTVEDNDVSSPPFEIIDSLDKIELPQESQLSGISDLTSHDSDSIDKSTIPLPAEEIKLENIPAPDNTPPDLQLENIELPKEPEVTDIPIPDDLPPKEKDERDDYHFKPIQSDEDDDDSSSDSSLRRNMSPITPIRNFNNENSCDAQQGFETTDSREDKSDENKKESTSSFRFTIESKDSSECSDMSRKSNDKKETEKALSYQFDNQMNINPFGNCLLNAYEDSSSSNNLHIDYESDVNSKLNSDSKLPESEQNSEHASEIKSKESKSDNKKSSHKSSHSSRDRHRDSSHSKDKRSDSKHSSSKDRRDSKNEKKSSKDEGRKSKSSHRDGSRDRSEKKDSKDPKHRHNSSQRSTSSHKDSKSHKSSSSHRHTSSNKQSDEKKSSSHRDKSEKSECRSSKDQKSSKDSSRHSSTHRCDKDKKSSSSKSKHSDDRDKDKKDKKIIDDHYSLSGRGNHNRRSTDRDSNDGNSSSSKGSNNYSSTKSSVGIRGNKSSSKSDNTSNSSDTSPSDPVEQIVNDKSTNNKETPPTKPIIRVDTHLEVPIAEPPHLPFKQEISLKKPKFAANFEEARQLIKMRKHLEAEERKKNQDAALLLEFQQNVRPNLSQVYSKIPGPELEFVCFTTNQEPVPSEILNNVVEEQVYEPIQDNTEYFIENVNNEAIEENNTNNMNVDKNKETISPDDQDYNGSDIESAMQKIHGEGGITHNDESPLDKEMVKFEQINSIESESRTKYFEVTVIQEEISEEEINQTANITKIEEDQPETSDTLHFFSELDKSDAEIAKDSFSKFYEAFVQKTIVKDKLYLINFNKYEEDIFKEASKTFGDFDIVTYYRNGHLKLAKSKPFVKDVEVNAVNEIILPLAKDLNITQSNSPPYSPLFSPVKSDCSFEMSSDYNAKIEAMKNTTTRQEIMEIILGGVIDGSPGKMPTIDICNDSVFITTELNDMKRKLSVSEIDNNNQNILNPNKIRKLSGSDQISSTTEGNFYIEFSSFISLLMIICWRSS